MEPHPNGNPPAPGARTATDPVCWTPDRQRLFLTGLLATGHAMQAARAAGMSPASAHRLRRRLVGTPFDRTWGNALVLHAQSLADALGGNGTRPVTPQARY